MRYLFGCDRAVSAAGHVLVTRYCELLLTVRAKSLLNMVVWVPSHCAKNSYLLGTKETDSHLMPPKMPPTLDNF